MAHPQPIGPVVLCVRGPSRSGKTSVVERLVEAFERQGRRVGWVKRTHHALDLPDKASGRVWLRGPAAMVLHSGDRLQLTLPPGPRDAGQLLAALPDDLDLVLLETHVRESYPTILSNLMDPSAGEQVIGRWSLETVDEDAASLVAVIAAFFPADAELDRALRAATRLHGGHGCAGLVLGARLALYGSRLVGIRIPDSEKRLLVIAETDRCAVDAIQAVTGCRPGKRTLRILDYGKVAATFYDQRTGGAIRVAARGDLRDRVTPSGLAREDRAQQQRRAYLELSDDMLFSAQPAEAGWSQFDLPGPPRRRVRCATCDEEISDGREVLTEKGLCCRPCAGVRG